MLLNTYSYVWKKIFNISLRVQTPFCLFLTLSTTPPLQEDHVNFVDEAVEEGRICTDCLCPVSFYQIVFRLPFKSTDSLKNKIQEEGLLLEPLQKHNEEGNAKFDSLHKHRLSPAASQSDVWESTCPPMSSSPWSGRRGGNQLAWQAEVQFIWCYPNAAVECYSHALSPSSSLVSQLTPPPCQGTPSSCSPPASCLYPGTPWQPPHPMARVSAEPCALALHGAAPGCWGWRQHWWVPRMTRLCLPSAGGFLPWPHWGLPHDRPEIQRCMPKSKELSHQCLPVVGKTPEASKDAGLMPGDNWVETFYSWVRKKMLLWKQKASAQEDWQLSDTMVTPCIPPCCHQCPACSRQWSPSPAPALAAGEQRLRHQPWRLTLQTDPADLIRTQLWRSWWASLLLLFLCLLPLRLLYAKYCILIV